MQAYILAGGKGTRLVDITHNEIPKPMAKICGKPILEHIIEKLKNNNVSELFISVGYLHEKIQEYFEDGSKFGVKINYIVENEPLGSAGAMYFLKDKMNEDFIVCPGDIIFDVNFEKMLKFHKSKNALITLLVHPNIHPYDSDLIFYNKNNCVTQLNRKSSERNFYYKNTVNSGISIISNKALEYFTELKKVNMEHDFVENYISQNKVFAYNSTEYVKDIGTPERFAKAEKDIQNHLVEKRNLKNLQKAIFLDRDGTINEYKGFITNVSQIEVMPNAIEAIRLINQSEYLAIIVSNQPVIARGEATFEQVEEMFDKIQTTLGQNGVYVDGIYYCPHHPHSGYEGEVKELKIVCQCRKPNIGMITKAQKDFNLDLSQCYIIGDTNADVKTGFNANVKPIKINSCVTEEDIQCTKAENLLEAVKIILKE